MKDRTRIALAVGLGYVLGRRRRLRTALTLGAAVAAGRMSRNSGQLLGQGLGALRANPQLSGLTQLGGPLRAAGRAAAVAAVGSGVEAVSGGLRRQTGKLRQNTRGLEGVVPGTGGDTDDGPDGEKTVSETDGSAGDPDGTSDADQPARPAARARRR